MVSVGIHLGASARVRAALQSPGVSAVSFAVVWNFSSLVGGPRRCTLLGPCRVAILPGYPGYGSRLRDTLTRLERPRGKSAFGSPSRRKDSRRMRSVRRLWYQKKTLINSSRRARPPVDQSVRRVVEEHVASPDEESKRSQPQWFETRKQRGRSYERTRFNSVTDYFCEPNDRRSFGY